MFNRHRSQMSKRQLFSLPEVGFIREADLVPQIIPISSATLWRLVKDGQFPSPIKLSPRVTAWRVSDVRKWLEARGEVAQ